MGPVAGPGTDRKLFVYVGYTHFDKACYVGCTAYCIGTEFRLEVELSFNISKELFIYSFVYTLVY